MLNFRIAFPWIPVLALSLTGCSVFQSDSPAAVPDADVSVPIDIIPDDNETENVTPGDIAPPPAATNLPTFVSAPRITVLDCPSPNFDRRTLPVSLIVLHYTAAPLRESLNALRNGKGNNRVSAHYVVAPNGTIYRLVDESQRAWHAGVSRWKKITDVNSASIGIEIVNLGHDAGGRPRPYPVKQIEAVTRLCLNIQSRHPITDVVGHSDVAPQRKIDPGELFPWRMLHDRGVNVSTRGFVPRPVIRSRR